MTVVGVGNTLLKNLNEYSYLHAIGNNQSSIKQDNRGRHTPSHVASKETIEILKEHIFSFPRERSHYTINRKMYLNPDLDIKKMYQLYKEQELRRQWKEGSGLQSVSSGIQQVRFAFWGVQKGYVCSL